MRLATLFSCLSLLFLCRAETINYTYDDAARLIRVSYGSGKTINYMYDQAGNLLRRLVAPIFPDQRPHTMI